jgi:hypothetical protein
MVKYCLILLSFLFVLLVNGQVSLETFINVYKKNSLTEAKKILKTIPGFRQTDLIKRDSLTVNIKEGNIKAYVCHNRNNLEFSFTNDSLYKTLYKQAELKFKYTSDYSRVGRVNGASRHITSFSNYEGAKIGSLEVLLVVVRSIETEELIRYELLLFPYYDD